MLRSLRDLDYGAAILRMIADLILLHASMIAALGTSVMYQVVIGNGSRATQLVNGFAQYYFVFAYLFSPIFLLIFSASGFYTRSRSYASRYKMLTVLRGVGLSVLVYLAIHFLFFREQPVGRSVVFPFAIFAALAATLSRFAKMIFEQRMVVKPKDREAVKPMGSTVLVVGGAGYIGSIVVRQLLARGQAVRVLDNLVYGTEPLGAVLHDPNLDLMVGDCRNIRDAVAAVQGVDAIIHLGAIVGDPACEQDRKTALEINYAATRMLIEVAKGNGVKRFLFASSCSVYGSADYEMDERAAVKPISHYAQTKVDSEQALLGAASETFHPAILRFATVFGLGYRPRFDLVVNLLSAKALQEGVITIYNGEQWRPFVHVRDLADAVIKVLDAPLNVIGGEVFNVGDSRLNYTLGEVAETIRKVFPDTRVEHIENSDRRNYRVNFDKIRYRLGFRCQYSLEDGIREIKQAFEEKLLLDYTDLRYHNQRFLKAAGSPENKTELDGRVMAAFANAGMLAAAELNSPAA